MSNRNHSLDALRVSMMLLGLVVHAGITYCELDVFLTPLKDESTSLFYDYFILFIHAFRMPVFFVLSGFFAALLYSKKGLNAVLWNRTKRIVFPLIVALIILVPFTKMMILHYAAGMSWQEIFASVKSLEIYERFVTGHLWFLYYLVIIYAACHLLNSLKPAFLTPIYRMLSKTIYTDSKKSYRTILLFSVLSGCFIVLQQQGQIDTSISLIPDPLILLTYCVYFGFGYILYQFQDELAAIFSAWKFYLFTGILLSVIYFFVFSYSVEKPSLLTIGASSVLCSLLSWIMLFGLMGLFMSTLNRESKTMYFLSQSSYWVYLVHLPLTVFASGFLLTVDLPSGVKFLLTLLFVFGLLIVSYKLFVEKTWIGLFLNGKKKPGTK